MKYFYFENDKRFFMYESFVSIIFIFFYFIFIFLDVNFIFGKYCVMYENLLNMFLVVFLLM